TQPDFVSCAAGLVVAIDGSLAGNAYGLSIAAPSTVRGLAIENFSGFGRGGIHLGGTGGSTVECTYLGTDATGLVALPNNDGITVESPDNVIGGSTPAARNVISGNNDAGVLIQDNGIGVRTDYAI